MLRPMLLVWIALCASLSPHSVSAAQTVRLDPDFGRVPLFFTPNAGQFDSGIVFAMEGTGELDRSPDEALADSSTFIPAIPAPSATSDTLRYALPDSTVIDYRFGVFRNINPQARIVAEGRLPWNANYFIGRDSSQWHTDLPSYSVIRHVDLWPNIDLVYTAEGRKFTPSLVVNPGARTYKIEFEVPNYQYRPISVLPDGTLSIRSQGVSSWYNPPKCVQVIEGRTVPVTVRYADLFNTGVIRLEFGEYDPNHDLILSLKYALPSYVQRLIKIDIAGIGADDAGNVYVGGSGVVVNGGIADGLYALSLKPNGSELNYVSYVKGAYRAGGIESDASGNVFFAGTIFSESFPITNNLMQSSGWQNACYVMRINPAGKIEYCTIFGGSTTETVEAFAIDAQGNSYLTGYTNSPDFIITPVAYDKTYQTNTWTNFVSKVTADGTSLGYSTFLKGSGSTKHLAVNANGEVYVAGYGVKELFPLHNPPGEYPWGEQDLFVIQFDRDGSDLKSVAFFGGTGTDDLSDIEVSPDGTATIVGKTYATDFPTTTGTTGPGIYIAQVGPGTDTISYSHVLSDIPAENAAPTDIFLDTTGQLWIIGSTNLPTFPVIPEGVSEHLHGLSSDVFIMQFNLKDSRILLSTLFGGSRSDGVCCASFGRNGGFYVSGQTYPRPTEIPFPYYGGIFDTGQYIHYDSRIGALFCLQFLVSTVTGIEDAAHPSPISLKHPYPNPFNPSTVISYAIPTGSRVELTVYSLTGQKVATLFSGWQMAGNHTQVWNAENLASGVYLLVLKCGDRIATRKISLIK